MQGKLGVFEACKHSMQGAEDEDELTLTSLLIDNTKSKNLALDFILLRSF